MLPSAGIDEDDNGSDAPALSASYETVPANAAPPRPDLLLGDAPPAAPTCGPPSTPCTASCAGPTRSSTARGARRPGGAPRRARRAGRPSCEDGLRRGGSAHPGGRRAGRRRRPPRPAAGRAGPVHALDARRLRRRCGSRRARSSSATWTAPPARSGGSWRRCSASPRDHHGDFGRLGVAFQLDELHPRRARGLAARPHLPARDDRGRRGGADWRRARARLRALVARRGGPRAALFAAADAAWPRAAPAVRPGVRLACAVYLARARPRRGGRLRRAGRRARRCAPWEVGRARRCSRRCGRDDPPRDRARRASARRSTAPAPTCSSAARSFAGLAVARELAGPRRRRAGRRPLRDRRARDLGVRGADAVAAGDGRRGVDPPGAALHGLPHAARLVPLPAAVELVASTTASCARRCGRSAARRAFETAKVNGRDGRGRRTPTAGTLTAPLIVDALGWRRVLGAGRTYQPPEAPLSRGLEVHPHAGGGDDLDVWIDRSLVRRGYLARAGGRRAARRRGLLRAAPPRQGADGGDGRAARRTPAVRYQGNWFPHRLRPAAEDGVFFVGDRAGHCFPLSGEGIRTAFYFGIACGRELRSVLDRRADRASRRSRATARSRARHAPAFRLGAAPPAPDPGAAAARCSPARCACWAASASSTARSAGTWTRPTRVRRRARPPTAPADRIPAWTLRLRRARPRPVRRAGLAHRRGAHPGVHERGGAARTRETGELHFWSRSRDELWHKGATSGNTQAVKALRSDCDADTLLALVTRRAGLPHRRAHVLPRGDSRPAPHDALPALERTLAARAASGPRAPTRRRCSPTRGASARRSARRPRRSSAPPARRATSAWPRRPPTCSTTSPCCCARAGSSWRRSRVLDGRRR